MLLSLALMLPATVSYSAATGNNKVGGTGTVVPRGGVVLIAGVPGYSVHRIFVQAGDAVKQGAPLFDMDSAAVPYDLQTATLDLETAKKDADYRSAAEALTIKFDEARVQRAKRALGTYRAVGPSGITERESTRLQDVVEEAQAGLDMERLHAQQLQYDLAAALKSATLRREATATNVGHFLVRAPSDGTVLKIDKRAGDYANGEAVLEFGDLSAIYVDAQVYQGDMIKVRPGMRVTVKNSAFADLGTGKVETVGRVIGTRSQLGDVRIRLDKIEPGDRLIGMEVEVVIGP